MSAGTPSFFKKKGKKNLDPANDLGNQSPSRSTLPSLHAEDSEVRMSEDGEWYTESEFLEFFGDQGATRAEADPTVVPVLVSELPEVDLKWTPISSSRTWRSSCRVSALMKACMSKPRRARSPRAREFQRFSVGGVTTSS